MGEQQPLLFVVDGQRVATACPCGHPAAAHELVAGRADLHSPDLWVCTGTHLTDAEADDPWDTVCGCVLYEEPKAAKP